MRRAGFNLCLTLVCALGAGTAPVLADGVTALTAASKVLDRVGTPVSSVPA